MSEKLNPNTTSRLFFIDNWKILLITLVLLHHTAAIYGAPILFYYMEPPFTAPLTYLVLLVFMLFNQSWFMGAFFLISGYFTPDSFDRKGPGSFLKDRLLRLGIPLVVFIFVLGPIAWTGLWQMPASITGITDPLTWQSYPKLVGIGPLGPMWFIAMLLIFDFAYVVWRMATRNRVSQPKNNSAPPGYLAIGIFIIVLALVSYLIRMVVPLGKDVLNFPTLAYLPQYLGLFVLGAIASRRHWFNNIPGSLGIAGFVAALVAGVLLFPPAISGRLFSLELTETFTNSLGNGHWQSAVYALWDSIFAVGLCLGIITLFRCVFKKQGKFGKFLSQHSYTVFVIHIPILVYVAVSLRGISVAHLLKFGMVAIIGIPVCFIAAYLVRKIPFVSRVL